MSSSESPAARIGTRTTLSKERILDAALRLIDEHGVEGLSMRRLGKELGVEAMSLYNHIPNKAALLDALVEYAVDEIPTPPVTDEWPERVRKFARSYRAMAHKHPHIIPLIAMRRFTTIAALRPLEASFAIFREAGFDPMTTLHAFRAISSFATGYLMAETRGFMVDQDYAFDPADLSPQEFPHLIELIPLIMETDYDEQFEFAIDVLIDGLKKKLPPA